MYQWYLQAWHRFKNTQGNIQRISELAETSAWRGSAACCRVWLRDGAGLRRRYARPVPSSRSNGKSLKRAFHLHEMDGDSCQARSNSRVRLLARFVFLCPRVQSYDTFVQNARLLWDRGSPLARCFRRSLSTLTHVIVSCENRATAIAARMGRRASAPISARLSIPSHG